MDTQAVLKQIEDNGFPFISYVHLFIGGSGLHGGRVGNTHDDDFYGVYVEPENWIIGLESQPHYVWSTGGQHERNQPGDLDVCLYGYRKWCKLAATGNPTALGFLFAPSLLSHSLWERTVAHADLFQALSHANAFERFAQQQLGRVLGIRGQGKHGQRPELEEKYGYDVKAAMHVIRLLEEGIEYLNAGHITYPRPERNLLIEIRSGKYTVDEIAEMAEDRFSQLSAAREKSAMPEAVDMKSLSHFVTDAYLDYWDTDDHR